MTNEKTGYISEKPSRNYGIDALRIVSMLMIVVLHILGKGGVLESSIKTNYWIAWFFEIACYCAVNCYALISGYVGVFSKYKLSNFALLWCRAVFYSVFISVLFICFLPGSVNTTDFILSFFPIISRQYWYFTAYALLFLFIPLLNAGIEKLSKRQLGFLLVCILTFTSLAQPITGKIYGDVFVLGNGYSAWWLIILYLVGGYIRKYGFLCNIKTHRTGLFLSLYLFFSLVTLLSKTLIIKIFNGILEGNIFVYYISITVVAAAVCLFLAFENADFNSVIIKTVSFLSPLAFSVYLIHCHYLVFDHIIAGRFIPIAKLPTPVMILAILCIAIGIYLLCSLIDFLRHYLFKFLKLQERLTGVEKRIKKFITAEK